METYIQIEKDRKKQYKKILDIVQTFDKSIKLKPSDTTYLKGVSEIWKVEEDKYFPGRFIKTCIFQKEKKVEIVTELGNDPNRTGEKYFLRSDDVQDGDTIREDSSAVNIPVDSEKFVVVSKNIGGEDIIL